MYDSDIKFVTTLPEVETPTPNNSEPLSYDEGRSSIVWFNEATMYTPSETGFPSLSAARDAGHSGKTSYSADVKRSFADHMMPLPPSL